MIFTTSQSAKRSSVFSLGLLLVVWFGGGVEYVVGQSVLERERQRRASDSEEAYALLKAGDAAYEAANYKKAVQDYGRARSLLVEAPKTAVLRASATQRYAQAAVEEGKRLAKIGEYKEARDLIDGVLARDVAPQDVEALRFSQQLDDPIRYNPALTRGHVKNVDRVRRLLYEAEGFYNLAQYDRAGKIYEEVLRIDPYNKAARRGMERGHKIKSDYYEAAYDETRAKMLSEVDRGWEDTRFKNEVDLSRTSGLEQGVLLNIRNTEDTELKLRGMNVANVDLNQSNLEEAVDYIRDLSKQIDSFELDPERKGLNLVIDLGTGDSEVAKKILSTRFDLNLKNVPLSVVLEHITEATRTSYTVEQYAIIVRPIGLDTGAMLTRRYQVPPDFLSSEAVNRQNEGVGTNPFDVGKVDDDFLVKKLSPKEFLKKRGIPFPEGGFANYIPNGSVLTVHNTRGNLELVESIIKLLTSEEPVQIMMRVTVIDVLEDRLKELGFDWLLGNGSTSGNLFLGGGTQGNGGALGAVPFALGGATPLTLGNRGGAQSNVPDTIESLFTRARPTVDSSSQISDSFGNRLGGSFMPDLSAGATLNRAPGVLSLSGFIGENTYQTVLRGLNQKKGVDLMVRPEVLTRPGQTASVESVREMIYPTEYEPPEVLGANSGSTFIDFFGQTATGFSGVATPAHPTAFETAKLGVVLEMEPNIDRSNNVINLSIKPALKEFEGFINYGTPFAVTTQAVFTGLPAFPVLIRNGNALPPLVPALIGNPFGAAWITQSFSAPQENDILMPVFKTTQLDTNVNIYNGATVVIGGLVRQDISKVRDKTPILGSLPYLGRFFQSEQDVPIRRAIIIMVNAEILDPSGRRISNQ